MISTYRGRPETALEGFALGEGGLPFAFEVNSIHQHHDSRGTEAAAT